MKLAGEARLPDMEKISETAGVRSCGAKKEASGREAVNTSTSRKEQ